MCELQLTHHSACILRPRRRGVDVTSLGRSGLQRPAASGMSERASEARFGTCAGGHASVKEFVNAPTEWSELCAKTKANPRARSLARSLASAHPPHWPPRASGHSRNERTLRGVYGVLSRR